MNIKEYFKGVRERLPAFKKRVYITGAIISLVVIIWIISPGERELQLREATKHHYKRGLSYCEQKQYREGAKEFQTAIANFAAHKIPIKIKSNTQDDYIYFIKECYPKAWADVANGKFKVNGRVFKPQKAHAWFIGCTPYVEMYKNYNVMWRGEEITCYAAYKELSRELIADFEGEVFGLEKPQNALIATLDRTKFGKWCTDIRSDILKKRIGTEDEILYRILYEQHKSLIAEPKIINMYYSLACTYRYLDQHNKALAFFEKVVLLDPCYLSYEELGVTYAMAKKYDLAIKILQRAILLAPVKSVHAHYNLGRIYLKIGAKTAALREYNLLRVLNAELAEQLKEYIKIGVNNRGGKPIWLKNAV